MFFVLQTFVDLIEVKNKDKTKDGYISSNF